MILTARTLSRQVEAITPQSHGASIPLPIWIVGIVVVLIVAGIMFSRSRRT